MYASTIVSERLGIARETIGFEPEYHSPNDIDEFERSLERRYADAYREARGAASGTEDPSRTFQVNITRALCSPSAPKMTRDEVRFIENERTLAMCDAAYFLSRYYWIKPPQGIQRFTFLPGQRVYFDVVAELEARRAAIELIVCKARQHGISTETEGIIAHRACFYYGVNAVVASADRGSTGKMSQMTFFGYDRLPWWIRPMSTRRVESDKGMLEFGNSESGITFQHGNQRYGIARGDTVKVYHLSEVASYSNADDLIEASLFKCVHPHPDVFGVLESTAEGDTGWWYDTYWHAKAQWKNNRSRLCPLFLPWFLGTDKYPTPTWIRTHPVPRDWRPDIETRKMQARAKLYIDSAPVLSKVLGAHWQMPAEQAWFWEVQFMEARSKGKEKLWLQEMPTDDREAFQGSYDNVFGREVIAECWSKRSTRYGVYGIAGQSIEDRYDPDPAEIDHSEVIIPVAYQSHRGETYRWELIPLLWEEPFEQIEDIRDDESHMGKLFVWHPPAPGYDYSIGVDTSTGIGCDSTVVAVSRRGRGPQGRDEQAAEFRSNRVSHVEAFAWVMAIAAYYSRYMEDSTPFREPYVAIEQIAAVGDTCQLQMRKMGYNRFHKMIRYDSTPRLMRKSKSSKVGWQTTGWSRPILTDGFVVLVQNHWYVVNSPYTLREMTQWEVHYTANHKEKFEHAEEATDDGIFANAIAAFCVNDTRTMAERSSKQFTDATRMRLPDVDITMPPGGIVVSVDGQGIMEESWR